MRENYNANDLNFIFSNQQLLIQSWDKITKSECTNNSIIPKDTRCQTYDNNSKLREEVLENIKIIQYHLSNYINPANSLFSFKRRSKKTSKRRSKKTSKRRSKKTSRRRSKKTSRRRSKKTSRRSL